MASLKLTDGTVSESRATDSQDTTELKIGGPLKMIRTSTTNERLYRSYNWQQIASTEILVLFYGKPFGYNEGLSHFYFRRVSLRLFLSPSDKTNVGLSNKTACCDPEPESECYDSVSICRNLIWSRFSARVSAK